MDRTVRPCNKPSNQHILILEISTLVPNFLRHHIMRLDMQQPSILEVNIPETKLNKDITDGIKFLS